MTGAGASPRRHITDLPVELQKTIFRNSSLVDLASLAVVSKHFHSIATAQLYRKLSINFNIGPGPFCRGHEAEAQLDAMVTSTHDNAQHLKEIFVDVVHPWMAPPNMTYDVTPCAVAQGHYLSTLLLLTLRKAKALEVFHWNARLKVSQEVFEQLHSLPSLRKLHVRHRDPLSEFANPAGPSPVLTLSLLPNPQTNEPAGTVTWKPPEKKRGTKDPSKRPFKSFSGFRHLTSLAVLNLSSRDHVSEIASCVRACSSTLEDFKLSLSPTLAMKAQEPPPPLPAESETDDDEDVEIPLPPPAATLETTEVIPAWIPSNEADRAAERAAQQEILDQIFKSGDSLSVAPTVEAKLAPKMIRDPIPIKVLSSEKVTTLVNRLFEISGKVDLGSVSAELPLSEVLRKVAQVMEELDQQEKGTLPNEDGHQSNMTPVAKPETFEASGPAGTTEGPSVDGEPSPANIESTDGLNHFAVTPSSMQAMYENAAKELRGPSPSLSSSGYKVTKTPVLANMNMTPEDIDIDHPDVEVDDSEDEDNEMAEPTQAEENGDHQGIVDTISVPNRSLEVHPGEVTMSGGLGHTVPNPPTVEAAGAAIQQGGPVALPLRTPSPLGKDERSQADNSSAAPEVAMKEYIRSTRKFAFRSFGLYLVPLRVSTVLGAIEVSHLSHITLLSVGNQIGFWNVMSTINKTTPVRLRSVFTDEVTMGFLRFAGEVQDLSELFLLRRVRKSTNHTSFHAYSPTIKDIRREVLKKHTQRLTKIHLKNLNDREWDVDDRTIQLLAKRGRALEEFGLSLNLENFHILLQYLPRLKNLRALHIIKLHLSSFRSPREALDFVMDTVTQHSRMRLEYVAAESEVVRVERKPKRTTTTKPKRSGLAEVLGGLDSSSDEVSSDVDASDPSLRSRQTVVGSDCGGLSEAKGVRIFNQDLLTGAL